MIDDDDDDDDGDDDDATIHAPYMGRFATTAPYSVHLATRTLRTVIIIGLSCENDNKYVCPSIHCYTRS